MRQPMLIEEIMPAVVLDRSDMRAEFLAACLRVGVGLHRAEALLARAPAALLECDCFLDAVSLTWRYEFGEPHVVGNELVWGIHTWPLVDRLCAVLDAADRLLTPSQHREYAVRLQDPSKHSDALTEFLPVVRARAAHPIRFESPTGVGNRTADWDFAVHERVVRFDVKYRQYDSFQLLARIGRGELDPDGTAPAPTHSADALFRSVETKFPEAHPSVVLQGAWIVSEVTQEKGAFDAAFKELDSRRVHFAILGTWESALYVVARRADDLALLLSGFDHANGTSPVFDRQ